MIDDPKWRGVPISELGDRELEEARRKTCEILRAIINELQRRRISVREESGPEDK